MATWREWLKTLEEEERVDDSIIWAQTPKGPLEKETEGKLSKIFGVLLTGERASGSLLYAIRKRALGEIGWIEEREEGEWFKEISPSQALGIATSETKFLSARGVTSFALDVLLDPTTYIGVGVIGKGAKAVKGVPKALRVGGSAGEGVTVGPLGVQYIQDTITKGISRETAEKNLVAAIGRGQTEYLAAKKFSESSVHIFGQKLFYTAPYTRAAKMGWDALPYAVTRERGVDLLKTAFVPFHKAIQDVGEEVKKPFLQFYRQTAYQKAKIGTRIKEISETTTPAQTKDVAAILDAGKLHMSPEEEAAKAAAKAAGGPRKILPEREIDLEARGAAAELRQIYDDAFREKVDLGMIDEDQYRKLYMHHTLTKEGRKFLEKKGGQPADAEAMAEEAIKAQAKLEAQMVRPGAEADAMEAARIKLEDVLGDVVDAKKADEVAKAKVVATVEARKKQVDTSTKFRQGSSIPRTMESSAAQINEYMLEKYGVKEFFVEDPYIAAQIYMTKHVKAVEFRKLRDEIVEKYGQPTGFAKGQAPETLVIDGVPQTLFKYAREKKQSTIQTTLLQSELNHLAATKYELAETYLPTSLVKELDRTHPKRTWWADVYDPAHATIKKSWLAIWPGYYARNIYGGVGWQNVLAGVEPADYARNIAVQYGDPNKVYDIPLYGKKTGAELKELMESHNVYGQTGYIGEPSTQSITGTLSKAYEKYPERAMHFTEDQLRGPVFLHYLYKTGDPEYAAEMVYKYHFEYLRGTYTALEDDFLRRMFSFYPWTRGNIPLQTEMIVRQPGTFAALAKWNEMGTTPEEYSELSDWQKENVVYAADDATITIDLPVMDLPGLYGPKDVYFGMNPFATWGVHALSGKDQFGRRMYPPTTLQGAEQYAEMTATTFAGRYVYAAREFERTRTGERPVSHTAIHQIAGVGVYGSQYDAETTQPRNAVQIGIFSIPTKFPSRGTRATVARVIDGDTIETEDGERIRLLGINTPERGEPGYEHAKQRLTDLVVNKEVYLHTGVDDKDHYGRSLRYVIQDGENINLKLVEEGYATAYFFPQERKYKEEIIRAEQEAIAGEVGPKWNETVREAFRTYEDAAYSEPKPTTEQKKAAWIAAGRPENARTRILQTTPTMELLSLTNEMYEASQGFKPTEKQMKYILTGLETTFPELSVLESPMQTVLNDTFRRVRELPGSREARYEELVREWQAFKAGGLQLEQPTEEQRMESWRRAGEPEKHIQKVFRDELGRLLGVATFTPGEIEELGTFKPSTAAAQWAFRDTRKMLPKKQLQIWAEEHEAELVLEEERRQELASLRTIKVEKGKEIPAVLKIGGTGTLLARRRELENMLGTGVDR